MTPLPPDLIWVTGDTAGWIGTSGRTPAQREALRAAEALIGGNDFSGVQQLEDMLAGGLSRLGYQTWRVAIATRRGGWGCDLIPPSWYGDRGRFFRGTAPDLWLAVAVAVIGIEHAEPGIFAKEREAERQCERNRTAALRAEAP